MYTILNFTSPDPVIIENQKCFLEVKAEVKEDNLILKVTGEALEPVRYFIADDKSKLISEKKHTENLKKGTYSYYVIDKQGCSKKGEIEIK